MCFCCSIFSSSCTSKGNKESKISWTSIKSNEEFAPLVSLLLRASRQKNMAIPGMKQFEQMNKPQVKFLLLSMKRNHIFQSIHKNFRSYKLDGCTTNCIQGTMMFMNFLLANANHHLFGVPLGLYATLNSLPLVSSLICFR